MTENFNSKKIDNNRKDKNGGGMSLVLMATIEENLPDFFVVVVLDVW